MKEQDRQRAIHRKLARAPEVSTRGAIATPWAELDTALGAGGLPRGRIIEIFGPSGSGKTTVALLMAACVQNSGGTAGWIDAEHAFDAAYAGSLGVSLDSLPLAQPESAEQAFEIIRQLTASGAVDLLVVDSAAALVPALELETSLGESSAGLQSRALATGLPTLARAVAKSDAVILFLNQTRSLSHSSGEAETSAGGPSLKLHAALRIALEAAGGARIRFRVVKNKSGEAFRQGELRLSSGGRRSECP